MAHHQAYTSPLRWLHLSDFHVGKDNNDQLRLFGKIVEQVKQRIEKGQGPDIIFITGDIANQGKAAEYECFNNEFIRPLRDAGYDGRIHAVPGNHDVDISEAETAKRHGVLNEYPRYLDPTDEGLKQRKIIFSRFESYVKYDRSDSEKEWLFSASGSYVERADIRGWNIGIAGLNSAWLAEGSGDDNDRHKLSPGWRILEKRLDQIKDCDLKIVLCHHPIDWFLDSEVEVIRSCLSKNNALYLHGHLHRPAAKMDEGAGDRFRVLQCGAAFVVRNDEIWSSRLLWCELKSLKEISIEPLQWNEDNQEWCLDGKAFPEIYRQDGLWVLPLPEKEAADQMIAIPQERALIPERDKKYVNSDETVTGITSANAQGYSYPSKNIIWAVEGNFTNYNYRSISLYGDIIYIGQKDKTVGLKTETGECVWKCNMSSKAVRNGNIVYVSCSSGLYAWPATENTKWYHKDNALWRYEISGDEFINFYDDIILFATVRMGLIPKERKNIFHGLRRIIALDSFEGKEIWMHDTYAEGFSDLKIVDNMVIFSNSTELFAIEIKSGKLLWSKEIGISSSTNYFPLDATKDVVVAGSWDPYNGEYFQFHCFSTNDGSKVSNLEDLIGFTRGNIRLFKDYLIGSNKDGKIIIWEYRSWKKIFESVSIYQNPRFEIVDHYLYCSYCGGIICFDLNSFKECFHITAIRPENLSAPIIQNDKIFVYCSDGFVYALHQPS